MEIKYRYLVWLSLFFGFSLPSMRYDNDDSDDSPPTIDRRELPKLGPYYDLLKAIREDQEEKVASFIAEDPSLIFKQILRNGFESMPSKNVVKAPTLLHYAARANALKIMTLLIAHKAAINAINKYGSIEKTPLDWACTEHIRGMLREKGGKTAAELSKES